MFENIGGKIMGFAKFLCALGFIASVITGVIFVVMGIDYDDFFLMMGLIIIVSGCLLSWITSWFMYAFGQLVDDANKSAKLLKTIAEKE